MKRILYGASALALIMIAAIPASAQDNATDSQVNQQLLQRIEKLESELSALRQAIKQSAQKANAAQQTAQSAVKTVAAVKKQTANLETGAYSGAESDAKWHLAGYADAGFTINDKASSNSFGGGQVNPILHFQYKDLLMFESELEFTTSGDGETNTELEYAQFDIFLNDYATLVAGKYISPIGQFKERLHPSWINKVADAPAGFGHDGVQPGSDTGLQLRGALPVGKTKFTYALAVGNGPQTTFEGEIGRAHV